MSEGPEPTAHGSGRAEPAKTSPPGASHPAATPPVWPIPRLGNAARPLRVCLDLNIWVADLLAAKNGRTGMSSQILVDIARRGTSSLGPVQLVVSWGMLNRLASVLERVLKVDGADAQQFTTLIAQYAARGPETRPPYLLLGGTGLVPLRDTEDAHVLEAADAGKADILVTRNFRDFLGAGAHVLVDGELAVIPGVTGHVIIVADPKWVMRWLHAGAISLP